MLTAAAGSAGVAVTCLPADVRISRLGELTFAFNFSTDSARFSPARGALCLQGQEQLAPFEMSIWRSDDQS